MERIVAEDAPYISLWYKVNAAVSQPSIAGIQLSPSAEFSFLRDVYRTAPSAGAPATARERR